VSSSPTAQSDDQHYIPKLYLKGFTGKNKKLYVYERGKSFRESKPKHEAHRPDYYAHSEQGKRDTTAEDALKTIESQVAPVISKLANPQYAVTREQMGNLYFFIALMFVRTPAWRDNLDRMMAELARKTQLRTAQDKEQFFKSCGEYEAATQESLGDWEKLREYILKGEYEIRQASVAFNLGAMFDSAFSVLRSLLRFSCDFWYAPQGSFFFTSDFPVITVKPDADGYATIGVGFGWPGVEVIFPVNKRLCIRLREGAEYRMRQMSGLGVARINKLIMATASHHLYAPEGTRRNARLFDQDGCKIRVGENAYLTLDELREYQGQHGKESQLL
jgi:hypothetical protein